MGRNYSIQIPTKPYLKKYLQSLYGNPVVFYAKNYFGVTVLSLMQRKFFFRQNETFVHKAFDRYTQQLDIEFPYWWMKQSHFPQDIPVQNILILNKLFEERFEEDLYSYVLFSAASGAEIKAAMESFCMIYNIEIPEDISYDALKKKEFRHRKEKSKNFIAKLSPEKIHPVKIFKHPK